MLAIWATSFLKNFNKYIRLPLSTNFKQVIKLGSHTYIVTTLAYSSPSPQREGATALATQANM